MSEVREFQIQLNICEEATGLKIRPKQEQLENKVRLLKKQLEEYETQQPLIHILKSELFQAQQAVREASKEGALFRSCK